MLTAFVGFFEMGLHTSCVSAHFPFSIKFLLEKIKIKICRSNFYFYLKKKIKKKIDLQIFIFIFTSKFFFFLLVGHQMMGLFESGMLGIPTSSQEYTFRNLPTF